MYIPYYVIINSFALLLFLVMRLTKPMLTRANVVSIDGRDIDDIEDPFHQTNINDINVNPHTPYESNSPALVLPQTFGYGQIYHCFKHISTYTYDMFQTYLYIHVYVRNNNFIVMRMLFFMTFIYVIVILYVYDSNYS